MKTITVPQTCVSKLRFPEDCCCCLEPVPTSEPPRRVEYRDFNTDKLVCSVEVRVCPKCNEHWKETEAYTEKKTVGETKVWGPFALLIMFGAFADLNREEIVGFWWHFAFWMVLMLAVAVIGKLAYYALYAPKSIPGHISGSKVPVVLSPPVFKNVGIGFGNPNFAARFEEKNADILKPENVEGSQNEK